jgi:MFS transporter, DHA1 family, multidrug resistance protein
VTTDPDPAKPPVQPTVLAVFLAALSMLGPFSIDTIFPAFPPIGREFAADPVAMQQTVSVYLVSYAVMSLFLGPWSDAHGRKPVILGGTFLYAFSSAAAALSVSLPMLLVCRSLQGFSAGAGMVVGRAIIRDLLQGAAAQRMMSQITMIFGIAPAIAPVVGAFLLQTGGWRGIFWSLALFATLLASVSAWWFRESHPISQRHPFAPKNLLETYRRIGSEPRFCALALTAAMNFGALFLYIASAPAFVLGLLRLPATGFPWLFVPLIAGLTGGAWLSGRLAGRISARQAINTGFLGIASACALNLLCCSIFPVPLLPWSVLPIALQAFGVSVSLPSLTLLALDCFPLQRGAASSVQAFCSLAANALIAGALSPLLSSSAPRLALGMSGLSATGLIGWRLYALKSAPQTSAVKAGDQALDFEVEPPL